MRKTTVGKTYPAWIIPAQELREKLGLPDGSIIHAAYDYRTDELIITMANDPDETLPDIGLGPFTDVSPH